ncbi:MAG TPA: hypothetical protein VIH72_11685 [Candidatus Acidoferrales bacterium]|jgi:hypothetical protein
MQKLEFSDAARLIGVLKSRPPLGYRDRRSKADLEELHQTTDELCVLYLSAASEEREPIRNLAAEPSRVISYHLFNHIGWAGKQISASGDGEWVRRGLAAASIENNRLDARDTFTALGGLYLAASSAGIDCSHYFQEVAELSNSQPVYPRIRWIGSMRDFLANFEQSEYFRQNVRPKIGKNVTPRLRNEIFSILANIWDPLDVRAGRYQRNEYASYVDDIYNLLVKGATDEQIEDHLDQTARRRMETKPPRSTPHAVRALRAINLSEDRT